MTGKDGFHTIHNYIDTDEMILRPGAGSGGRVAYRREEGCLSLDGVRKTTRYQNIEVEYLDSGWKKHRQKFSGWTAQIVQHEIDHFSGKII